MKRIITSVALICSALTVANAQISISNVPANASLVIKYSRDNFSKNVPLKKLASYNFVKNNLFKALKIDSLTSLEGTGISFGNDVYQYVVMDDSATSFVTLFNLLDVPQFLKLVQANYHAEMKPEQKNGFQFLATSRDTYLGWNDKQAIFVFCSYKNKKNYYDYPVADSVMGTVVITDSASAVVDAPIEERIEEIREEPAPQPAPKVKKQIPGKKKNAAVRKGKKGMAKKPAPKKKVEEPEEIMIDEVKEYHMSYEDSIANEKREAWYQEQEIFAAAKQKLIADSIINMVFNAKNVSIENEVSYKKIIDPAAHVSVWLNYDNMMNQYWSTIFRGWGKITRNNLTPVNFKGSENKGFRSGINVFFEKDKMRLDQKMYSPDEEMAALGREIYNSKQSNSLAGYISPDNIACMSASINTEAMANYYYKLIRQYLSSNPYTNEYSGIVDVYMDLMEIIIDEKAIAELMPGNMVMVLHDMKTKSVTYTDYVYDDNFKSKEVTRTKQELSPNFTFAMETKKEAFMQKLAKLPLKFAAKEKFNYKEEGGYYELAFDADKYPISSLYFMVKDGKAIVTTSKEVIDMTLNNTGYALDAATKNSILNNNMYLRINTKKMIRQINPELSTDLSKKISNYLEENMGDVKMEGGIKDGMMQGTTTMNITGNHANSLEFFFNMIDAINDIMEKDKLEREKKD
ncbi:MAG: hypothetical protein IPP72_20445 [Chitinophagaceae bacterium]|nr:hypothetical protein [Chitinophagaceae bacterium]